MAPEVRNGGKATPASDAYAVGVLLFRLLTGSWLTTETRLEEALAGLDYNVTNVIKQTVYEIVTFTNVVDRPAKRQK